MFRSERLEASLFISASIALAAGTFRGTIGRMRSVLLGLALTASAAHAQAALVDRVVAIVDGRPILRSAVKERLRQRAAKPTPAAPAQQLEQEARAQLIEALLIDQDADALRLEVSVEEVDRAMAMVATSNRVSPEQLTAEVLKQGYTVQAYRAKLREQIREMRWLLARKADTALPRDSEEYQAFLDAERARLVAALRAAATIEELP